MLTHHLARSVFPVASVARRGTLVWHQRSIATGRTEGRPLNFYDEIMVDHNNIRDLHDRFIIAHKQRDVGLMDKIANTMVHEASIHNDSEERSVYKALEKAGLRSFVKHDRQRHTKLDRAWANVDTNSVASMGADEFADAVEDAYQQFSTHAEEEEKVHFVELANRLSDAEKSALAREYLAARHLAPTRPHPAAPKSGGRIQKMVDSMLKPLDAIVTGRRESVGLKYKHGAFA